MVQQEVARILGDMNVDRAGSDWDGRDRSDSGSGQSRRDASA